MDYSIGSHHNLDLQTPLLGSSTTTTTRSNNTSVDEEDLGRDESLRANNNNNTRRMPPHPPRSSDDNNDTNNNNINDDGMDDDDEHDGQTFRVTNTRSMSSISHPEEEEEEEGRLSTNWYSNPMQISAMISNFSTSYNVVNISLVLPILEQVWTTSAGTTATTENDKSAVASSLLAGMMVGQLLGGGLGDSRLGRLGALLAVMALQSIASLASATSCTGCYSELILWRFLLGVGAGGVYPLSAVLSAEQGGHGHSHGHSGTNSKSSLHLVVLTFSMQGVGFFMVPLVAVVLLYTVPDLEVIWRVILALGCLPGLGLMVLQWWIYRKRHHRVIVPTEEADDEEVNHTDNHDRSSCETHEDHDVVSDNHDIAVSTVETPSDNNPQQHRCRLGGGWWEAIKHEENLVHKLVGTAGAWFLFDVLFYGNTLFQPIVIEAAFGSPGGDSHEADPITMLRKTALHSLFLTSIAVPGYAVAGMVLGSKGRCSQTPRFVMLQGFAIMSLLYLIIGAGWVELRQFPALLVTLYSLTFFFANYGPNTTTFVLPSLVFSPECRSTLNGMSAAAGKLGAWTGATLFAPTADALGDPAVLILCSLIAMIAFFLTIFYVPRCVNDDDDNEDGNGNEQEQQQQPPRTYRRRHPQHHALPTDTQVVSEEARSDNGSPDRTNSNARDIHHGGVC